jgi:hypothetical protein
LEAGQKRGRERWRPLAARTDRTVDPISTPTYLLLGFPVPGFPVPGFGVEPPVPCCEGVLPGCEPPEPEPPIPPPLPLPGVPLIPPPGFEPPDGFGLLVPPELPGLPDLLGLLGLLGSLSPRLLRSFSRSAMVLPPIMKSVPGTDAPGG